MLNSEADFGSEDEDEAVARPVKRLRATSPQLDGDEEMMAGVVAPDGDEAESVDGGLGDVDASDDGGNEEMGDDNDIDIGGNDLGGGMNNGVFSLSFIICKDV